MTGWLTGQFLNYSAYSHNTSFIHLRRGILQNSKCSAYISSLLEGWLIVNFIEFNFITTTRDVIHYTTAQI